MSCSGAKGIEINFVLAAKFQILQTGPVAQGVVSLIQNMIRFLVGKLELEQVQILVDRFDQANSLGQQMEGAVAAMRNSVFSVTELVTNVRRRVDWPVTVPNLRFDQSVKNSTLAPRQLAAYHTFHSKLLFRRLTVFCSTNQIPPKPREFRVFFVLPQLLSLRGCLVKA